MRYTDSNGTITIFLEGRVDTSNADEIGEELDRIIMQADKSRVTLDANALDYISSAGLRIVIKLLKTCHNLRIANASPDVYDVLQMTGLTEMMSVARRPREVSLEGLPQIGAGAFGRV